MTSLSATVAAPEPGGAKERTATNILKRLATEAGLRARGEDGHRKRPSMEDMEKELMLYVKRGKAALQEEEPSVASDPPTRAVSREASTASPAPESTEPRFTAAQLKHAPKHVAKFPEGVPQLCGQVIKGPGNAGPEFIVIGRRTSCPTNSVLCVKHAEAEAALKDSTHVIAKEAYEGKAIDVVVAAAGMSLDCLRQYRVRTLGPTHGLSVKDMTTPLTVKCFFGLRQCVVYDIKKLGQAPVVVQECATGKALWNVDASCIRRA